jgi:hypothetical protein
MEVIEELKFPRPPVFVWGAPLSCQKLLVFFQNVSATETRSASLHWTRARLQPLGGGAYGIVGVDEDLTLQMALEISIARDYKADNVSDPFRRAACQNSRK